MPPFFQPHSAQSNPMRALKGPTRRLSPKKVAGRYRGLAKSLHPAVQHYGVAFPDDPWNSYDYLYCHSARDKIRQPLISLSAIIRRLWIGRFCFPAPLFWLGRATSISAPVQSSSSPVFFFFFSLLPATYGTCYAPKRVAVCHTLRRISTSRVSLSLDSPIPHFCDHRFHPIFK